MLNDVVLREFTKFGSVRFGPVLDRPDPKPNRTIRFRFGFFTFGFGFFSVRGFTDRFGSVRSIRSVFGLILTALALALPKGRSLRKWDFLSMFSMPLSQSEFIWLCNCKSY